MVGIASIGVSSGSSNDGFTGTSTSGEEAQLLVEPTPAPPPTPLPVPEELTGARLNRVLDQLRVSFPSPGRDIDDGNSLLAAGDIVGNTLGYMLDVIETSEQGLLFMTKDGRVGFRERLLQPREGAVQFIDFGDGVPYIAVETTFGTDLLVNQAVVEYPDGVVASENQQSQVIFGITEKTLATQLASEAQAEALAAYIVRRYGYPDFRVSDVTINLRALSPAQVTQVLGLEIGDQADLVFTPNGFGRQIAIRNRIIGIGHDVGLDSHTMSFSFEDLPFDFYILDDEVFGKLDNTDGVLGF
jgi:hypothetical protein